MTLMYSNDDEIVTRAELAQLDMHKMGSRHQPTSFYHYTSTVVAEFRKAGYEVHSEEYVLTKDKGTFFGAMSVTHRGLTTEDFDMIVGMRGSHVQKVSRGLLIGESVIVCSNLCFDGDLGNWKTKQTLNMQHRLPSMIRAAVDTLPDRIEERTVTFERLKDQRISARYGDAKLVDIYRAGGLSGNELPRAINEFHDPSFDHGEDLTLWRLFNAATEALKPTGARVNMQTVADRSTIVSRMMGDLVK